MRSSSSLLTVALAVAAIATASPAAQAADDVTPAAGADEASPEAPLAVAVVPLQAGRTITAKQAAGVLVQLRQAVAALAEEGVLKHLPTTKDDDKAVRRCGQDVACWTDTATARGADVVLFGSVEPGDGAAGLRLVGKTTGRAATERTAVLTGDDDATTAALDRLARELLAPETLRGGLALSGQAGDVVVIDGQRRGTIGEDGTFTVERLREGTHPLEVSRPAGRNGELYAPFTRDVTITHRETTSLKIVLLPRDETATLGEAKGVDGPPVLAIATLATGGAIVAGGATVGVLALLDGLEVEKRAEAQQLVFPRDEALVSRGRTLSVVANILYGTGVVVAGAGAAWWLLSAPAGEDDGAPAPAASVGGGR